MADCLWTPSPERVKQTNMYRFMQVVNETYGQQFSDYDGLYQWSINNIGEFWATLWEFAAIKASRPFDQVVDDPAKMPGAKWFSGARLNFAENLLRCRDDRPALVFRGEDKVRRVVTYRELYNQTSMVAASLRKAGIKTGDRVVGLMPNMPETIIAMLATASLGAVWSSASPDFGVEGVMDRFGQIEPKGLFCVDGYYYNGKVIYGGDKNRDV